MAASEGLTNFAAASSVSVASVTATSTTYFLDVGGVTHLKSLMDDTYATKAEAQAGVIPGGKIWIE